MAIELDAPARPAASAASAAPSGARWRGLRRGLNARQRMFLLERLALLLGSGNALHEALVLLARQAEDRRIAEVLDSLGEEISRGLSFSQALSRHPESFPPIYSSLVAAAERGGFLAEVLAHLSSNEERNARLNSIVVSAMSYPVFLVLFSLAVIVFVLTFVFPKFAVMFATLGSDLPLTTRVLMVASDGIRHHWPWIAGVGGAVVAGVVRWATSRSGAIARDRLLLRVPLLSRVAKTWNAIALFRVLGLALGHGVSVPDALRAARDVPANSAYRRLVRRIEASVQEGRGLSPAVESSDLLPDLARQMMRTGEQTGQLAETLTHLADFYERELTRWLQMASRLAEPLLLMVMGVVVGLVVSSLILPIFKLARAIH